ncbi:hypothetical protein [Streptomyces axinellae]|uniref:Uncharacterized protein n=1 Tax=Streptomyces axinellae TaxID=552788 RepID=A0ABN3QAW5_9ACTN
MSGRTAPAGQSPSILVTLPMLMLICWGTDDAWIAAEYARESAPRTPGTRLRLIGGAGRLVQEDAPARPTEALLRFLLDDAAAVGL